MTNKKKLIIAILILLLAGAGVFWWVQRNNQPNNVQVLEDDTQEIDPHNPNFIIGEVTEASQSHIYIQANGQRYVARLGFSTVLVKQAVQADGVIRQEPAGLTEYVPGTLVTAYFSDPGEDNVFDAVRIQIMN